MLKEIISSSILCNKQLWRLIKQFSFTLAVNYSERLSSMSKLKSNRDYNYYLTKENVTRFDVLQSMA